MTWPPPPAVSSLWREFTPSGSLLPVRARQVVLWGQPVWIAQLAGEWRVWCPSCREFRTTAKLGAPGNRCPVGLIRPSGTIVPLAPGDDGPVPKADPEWRELHRVSW